jgi:hypothetical protein
MDALIRTLSAQRYAELYEEEPTAALDAAVRQVLDALGPDGDASTHARLLWMARALATSAAATFASHVPEDGRAAEVLQTLADATSPQFGAAHARANAAALFFPRDPPASQALAEATSVLRSALEALDPDRARAALASMIEDCLEGYAIIPGAEERRQVFDWWLEEVVPAAFALRTPARILTLGAPILEAPAVEVAPSRKKRPSTLLIASATPGPCARCRHSNQGTADFAEGHLFCQMDGATKRRDQDCQVELRLPRHARSERSSWGRYFAFEEYDGRNGTYGRLENARLMAEDADDELRTFLQADIPVL